MIRSELSSMCSFARLSSKLNRFELEREFYPQEIRVQAKNVSESLRLDNNTLTSDAREFQKVKRSDYVPKSSRKRSVQESIFWNRLKRHQIKTRKWELIFRIHSELELAARDGWYVFFVTYTVSDEYYKQFFGSVRLWTNYQQRLLTHFYGRDVARSERGPIRDYHRYVSVVERGSKTGRLHMHCLHFFRPSFHLPTDPNFGRNIPDRSEVKWPEFYGFVSAVPVRYGQDDVFGRAGYRWPYFKGKPKKPGTPGQLAGYMAKYVTKAFEISQGKEETWRTRMSQKFGLQTLQLIVDQLPKRYVSNLSQMKIPQLKLHNQRIPLNLLRKLLTRRRLKNLMLKLNSRIILEKLPSQPNLWKKYNLQRIMIKNYRSYMQHAGSLETLILNNMGVVRGPVGDGDWRACFRLKLEVDKEDFSFYNIRGALLVGGSHDTPNA